MPIGYKTNKVSIPNKILNSTKLSIACLRGIFNTDGSVYRMYSKMYAGQHKFYANYAVVEIKIKSEILIHQIESILIRLKFHPNKVRKGKTGAFLIRLTSQTEIERFISLIVMRHRI